MTCHTFRLESFELLVGMTRFTHQRLMRAIKWKDVRMVEIFHIARPIMTVETRRPIFLRVLLHEGGAGLRMASDTYLHINDFHVRGVTRPTQHRFPRVILLM